ncbi:MAG: ACT domain-containing protein [Erysipelotrichaceae bacterium]|nr:ACT domain-containing protein [Erysipelotrichaceae bacterium]
MKAIISVVGKDRPGIMAMVSTECSKNDVNIVDVSQTVLQGMFTMIMICEINKNKEGFKDFVTHMEDEGLKEGLSIHVMHEDIFNAMHKI